MNDRLRLVSSENRSHLAVLLREGDAAAFEALTAYHGHVSWARDVHTAGWMSPEEIPSFLQADAGKQVLSQSRRRLIALAATLMADRAMRVRSQPRFSPLTDIDHLTERILDRLATRKLPYTPEDAAVIIDLAVAYPWLEQLRLALRAARLGLDAREAAIVIRALRRLDAAFLEEPKTLLISKVMSYHPQVRALLAKQGSDLAGAIGADDAFGPALAGQIRRYHTGWDSVEALTFFSTPRGTRPSAAWWNQAERRTSNRNFSRLTIDLLDIVGTIDLTGGSTEEHGFYHPDVVLLGEVNTIIVRGAAWCARFIDQPDTAPTLSRAALRCSSLVRGWSGVQPMSSKVAYAAVDSLIAIDSKASRTELDRLVTEVQATPVFRRIAQNLGLPESEIKAQIKARRAHRLVHRADNDE